MENKLTEEMGRTEFLGWCEANDIDYDIAKMNDEDAKGFEEIENRVVKSICNGTAVIDGDVLEYTLSEKNEGNIAGMKIKISSPRGNLYLGMDGYKETQTMHKLWAMLSALTGLDVGVFSKMVLKDLKFCRAVLSLFLAS